MQNTKSEDITYKSFYFIASQLSIIVICLA